MGTYRGAHRCGCWLLALLLLTVTSGQRGGRYTDLVPFHELYVYITSSVDASIPISHIGGNLLLFVPFGVLAPLRFRRLRGWRALTCVAGVLAVGVELSQFVMGLGRTTTVDDVILAVTGALVGFALAAPLRTEAR